MSGCSVPTSVADAAAPAPAPEQAGESQSKTPADARSTAATFVSVIDGDTIETSAGTVRIIGIDTPERGECGDDEASAAIADVLSPGDPVDLVLPAGQNDLDQYGRLIRYVVTGAGVDIGWMQLHSGNAVARFDSFDGYPAHPRERDYQAIQLATLSPDGSVITISCRTAATSAPAPDDRWWEQYSSCTKLKANGAGHPIGPFHRDDPAQAEPYTWFADRTGNRGDGDGDGLACE